MQFAIVPINDADAVTLGITPGHDVVVFLAGQQAGRTLIHFDPWERDRAEALLANLRAVLA